MKDCPGPVFRDDTALVTDDTGTAAEHRGKGLARAVKVESLRRLREDHPEVEAVNPSVDTSSFWLGRSRRSD